MRQPCARLRQILRDTLCAFGRIHPFIKEESGKGIREVVVGKKVYRGSGLKGEEGEYPYLKRRENCVPSRCGALKLLCLKIKLLMPISDILASPFLTTWNGEM
jgi:hypothetical protein